MILLHYIVNCHHISSISFIFHFYPLDGVLFRTYPNVLIVSPYSPHLFIMELSQLGCFTVFLLSKMSLEMSVAQCSNVFLQCTLLSVVRLLSDIFLYIYIYTVFSCGLAVPLHCSKDTFLSYKDLLNILSRLHWTCFTRR